MAKTVNEEWLDALLRHQIYSLRVAGSVRDEINQLLLKTENDIARWIRDALRGSTDYTPARLRKAERALERVKSLRANAWAQVNATLTERMVDYVLGEADFLAKALETIVPVVLDTEVPPAQKLRSIVRDKPFEGRTLKEWARTVQTKDLRRIEDQIKIGLVRGETNDVIARRLVGTKRMKGVDGALQLTRNELQSLARTAVNHLSNSARQDFFEANSDLFTEEIFVATLDGRTTPICRSLDGRVFKRGEGPVPPLHWNCRSTRVASINGELLGSRPSRAATEKMLLREFAKMEGTKTYGNRSQLPRGMKGLYDSFKSRRLRELTSVIPAKMTYGSWLRGQSAAFQDDVLGRTRGLLFRNGGLTLDKFVDRAGKTIPLAELAKRDAAAFRAAGLDPRAFQQ